MLTLTLFNTMLTLFNIFYVKERISLCIGSNGFLTSHKSSERFLEHLTIKQYVIDIREDTNDIYSLRH